MMDRIHTIYHGTDFQAEGRSDPPLLLAPMAGYTDMAFRVLCKSFGCTHTVTEMVSAKGLIYGSEKTADLLISDPSERPIVMQLFGREPEALSSACMRLFDTYGDDLLAIDLNLGCPARKITGNGEGSALLREPVQCGKIIEAMVKSVPVPVSVKLRKGFAEAESAAPEIARIAEASGASLITIHGRTREQGYSGQVDLACIRAVKQAVRIPVIGNGDINGVQAAKRMLSETGCDGLMIGRAALGRPWIFEEIRAGLNGEAFTPPTGQALVGIILRHVETEVANKGDHGIIELRKHLPCYLGGGRSTAQVRVRLNSARTAGQIEEILLDTFGRD